MIAVCDQCRTVQPVTSAAAYQRRQPVAGESDDSGEREDQQVAGRGRVDQAHDRLIPSNARRDEDRRHDRQASQALGTQGAQRERDPERDRGQRIPAVMNQVGQQREAATEREHNRLHGGRYTEDGECEHDGANALARALDALVDKTVRVTMRVFAVTLTQVLMAVMRVMFVRPSVWVGVAQLAMTVQIALDWLIRGGGHGQVSIECACIAGLDR